MYPIPPNETIVETKTCKHCGSSYPITDKDMEFYEKVSPVFGGKKYLIPPPTLCPECRQQRRQCFKNIYHLYKNEETWLISAFSPDKDYNIVPQKIWWEDTNLWLQEGRDFDFSRPFFEQFRELQKVAPRWNLIQVWSENCEWCINMAGSHNCYYIKSWWNSEDCYYGERVFDSESVVDGYRVKFCNNCYDVYYGDNCRAVFFSKDVKNSRNSMYVFDCDNVSYCIGCVWLRNKEYHILNKQVTWAEFEKQKQELLISRKARNAFVDSFNELRKITPVRCIRVDESENCFWNEIFNSKNVIYWFSVRWWEYLKYIFDSANSTSTLDSNWDDNGSYTYECSSNYEPFNSCFCFNTASINDCFYCETSANLNHCFGCVGLNSKSYCIFNKQYTREEYEALVPRIIEHMMVHHPTSPSGGESLPLVGGDGGGIEWGEFYSPILSPYGYNEAEVQEYFPLTKEEATKGGIFNWSDYEAPFPKVEKIIPAKLLPENIADIPDDILNWAIECEVTKKPFRIIRQELEFYRKHNLPIPRRHPDQRHLDRMALRNPRKLFARKCDKCGKDLITTYSPDRPETVYCGDCYNREVIG